jgi:hypothetical protein
MSCQDYTKCVKNTLDQLKQPTDKNTLYGCRIYDKQVADAYCGVQNCPSNASSCGGCITSNDGSLDKVNLDKVNLDKVNLNLSNKKLVEGYDTDSVYIVDDVQDLQNLQVQPMKKKQSKSYNMFDDLLSNPKKLLKWVIIGLLIYLVVSMLLDGDLMSNNSSYTQSLPWGKQEVELDLDDLGGGFLNFDN